jgi:crotonobetainyl-CoA:carnitine CoA-transferase CaiB-like acyl-CoA transferase
VNALDGLRILDLSRILAGPSATQLLGDLGADVIKVERPGRGDDTRGWGPPYARAADGSDGPSAYFLCANRNKRSIAIDLGTDAGATLVRRLARSCDVLVENYKVGDLARRGLDYASLRSECPRLVYCSITGFGQTGPRANESGYDFVAQALGGIMSLTGEPEGEPVKVGVGIADLMCGMYAATAILAALRHRDRTGEGQHVDLALYDTQVAWLANEGASYLLTEEVPKRRGNTHATIVPYRVFATRDGHVVLAIGNDAQFARFASMVGRLELVTDARFATNDARVRNRDACDACVGEIIATRATNEWVELLAPAGVPCSPVRTLDGVFADPHTSARGMRIAMDDTRLASGQLSLIGNPIHASATPPTYRRAPPRVGEHSDEILRELGLSAEEVDALASSGVVSQAR